MNKSKFILLSSLLFSITQAADAVTVIDDFGDAYPQYTKTREQWWAGTWPEEDAATISNAKDQWGGYKAVSSDYAELSGINATSNQGAGMGFNTKNNGKHYQLANCTDGFSYEYKGEAHSFILEWKVADKTVNYYSESGSAANWTSVTATANSFIHAPWTEEDELSYNKIGGISWTVNGPITNGSLQVRNIRCLGDLALTPENSLAWTDVSTLFSQEKFTGSAIEPKVTVKYINPDGTTKTLSKGKDYTVTYSNNTARGSATVTVTGAGDYSGTKDLTFEIADLPQGGLFWTAANGMQLNFKDYDFIDEESSWLWAGPNNPSELGYRNASFYNENGKIESWEDDSNDEHINDNKNFLSVTPDVGLQGLLTAKNGTPNRPAEAYIGIDWKENKGTINMRDFGGLCFTYNLTGHPMLILLDMPQDKYNWEEGYDRYYFVLEPGNHSVDISWSEFFKTYGITKLQDVVENSTGIVLMLRNSSADFVQTQFTLREFGAYGSCSDVAPPAAEYAGKMQILQKGGLMWKFTDILENKQDQRVQIPEIVALLSDDDYTNDWNPNGDGSYTGGSWYSTTFKNASVYQKGGKASWTENDVQKGDNIKTKEWDDDTQTNKIIEGGVFDNEDGLQVRLVTEKGGDWEGSSGAAIAFDWKGGPGAYRGTENISAFEGLCLVYNLTGDSLRLNIAWDGEQPKHPWNTHGLYGVTLPPGNHSVNFPWNAFKKEWGLGELNEALEEAAQIQIVLNSSLSKDKQALFTLREFGSLGSCSGVAPEPAYYGEDNGLVPTPEPEDIFWNFASGNQDIRIMENSSKKNENGWFYGYAYGPPSNGGWYSNEGDYIEEEDRFPFNDNFTQNGLQVGLIANPAIWNDESEEYGPGGGAGFGFPWNNKYTSDDDGQKYDKTEDIKDFGGFCLVYAMEGNVSSFDLELTVDDKIYGWSTFFAKVPNTNGRKAMVNIPWSNFYKTWGETTKAASLQNSKGLNFRIYTETDYSKNAQITLLQIGKLGKCPVPRDENVEFLSPDVPEIQALPRPIINDKKAPEVAIPVISSLQLNAVSKGLNVVAGSSAKLTLFNLKGSAVMQKYLGAGETFVSLQNLKSGIYIAQVRQGSQVKTIKVSK